MARYRGKWEFDGFTFRSKFEVTIAKQLKKAGIEYDYEKESYEYFTKVTNGICNDCLGTHVVQRRWYTPDFFLPNGVVIEAKGHLTASNRTILKAVREDHPTLDLKLMFQSDNRISRSSETRYTEWASKQNIDWAIREVPEKWTL
jgi:hypothetical protein